jgi:hypothetical protein
MAAYRAKPPKGSRLNRGDSLAKSLTAAWLFNDTKGQPDGAVKVRNAAEPGRYDFTCPAAQVTFTNGIDGSCVDRTDNASTSRLTLANSITSGTTFSIATRIFLRGMTATYGVVLTNAASAGFFLKSSGGFKISYFGAADRLSASTITANTWTDLVITCAAGAMTYYFDGVTDANTFTSVPSTGWNNSLSDSANERLNAQLAYLYTWVGRALTRREVLELKADPYRIFRRRSVPVPLFVAAASAFKPYWAVRRSQIIGGGTA